MKMADEPKIEESPEETEIEFLMGKIYMLLFRLRKSGNVQLEYDIMGTILDMLMEDREHIRKNFKIKY